jgi:diacylglycerol kinase (ATP)
MEPSTTSKDQHPVRATLMHNPGAGDSTPSGKKLARWLEELGYRVAYQSTKQKKWAKALEDPGHLVVVAGGDGTVNKVARHLLGTAVPLTILPLGSANNIARALGITGKPKKLIAGLKTARHTSFDVGLVRGSWGESPFFEGVGVGLFAEAMCLADSKEGTAHGAQRRRKFVRDLRFLSRALVDFEPRSLTVMLDGKDLSGDYLLCEIMNTCSIGPRLPLVRDADPTDGLLDILLLEAKQRQQFRDYLISRSSGEDRVPNFPVRRARRVQISIDGHPLRVDDTIQRARAQPRSSSKSEAASADQPVEVVLKHRNLTVLLPKVRSGA